MDRFKVISADEVIEMLKGHKYDTAQVHHTYIPDHSDFTGSNHIALQESMYRFHVNVRGWDDIGQHLTCMPDGKFVTGRDFDSMPAGIKGYNTRAFMIEHVGNFDKGHDALTGAQLNASLKVYHYLVNNCGAEVMFHTEHAAKTCPGTSLNKHDFVYSVITFKDGLYKDDAVLHPTQEKVKSEIISFVLGVGDEGPKVKELQNNLKKLKYNIGQFGADGKFGRDTKAAVRKFQADHRLVVDGLAGPNTFAKIESELDKLKTKKPSGSAIVPYPGIVKIGKRGKDVERIQRAVGATIDGIYGPNTAAAVRRYQERHGLQVDGIVGPNTWNMMF